MNSTAPTVLLTGASGFVGRPTLDALLARGFQVHAVSRHAPAKIPDGVTWRQVDLLDSDARRELITQTKPAHLVHLAWEVDHGRFWTAAENSAWVDASIDLLRLFGENGGRRALLTGSCAEYDWTREPDAPFRESDACRPATAYGRAKLALFERGTALAAGAGFSLVWARLFLMFGFYEDPRRFVPSIIRGLLANGPVALRSGRQIRDFLDTRDAGAALASLLENTITGAVNVASGRGIALREAAETLTRLADRPASLLQFGTLPDREGEPKSLVADVRRLTKQAAFTPVYSLEQRLAECLTWHKQQMRSG